MVAPRSGVMTMRRVSEDQRLKMNHLRFDTISKLFAERRLSRRAAVCHGAAGLAAAGLATTGHAAAAQDTPPGGTPVPDSGEKVAYLFLQSFQARALTSKEGEDGTYTLTLDQGLGQTIYFSDRPLRDVGATPTPDFLESLGFPLDNPPNAALLVEEGNTVNVAVVERFNPRYDQATRTATYDMIPLADFQRTADGGFGEAPADLSAVPSSFRAAHLFIDDCPDGKIFCTTSAGAYKGDFGSHGFCWNYATCVPCEPYYHANPYNGAAWDWWTAECNRVKTDCQGACVATPFQPAF